MELARHAIMKEARGIDIEEEFRQGRIYMVLEYSLRFRQSLKKGDRIFNGRPCMPEAVTNALTC